jgi:hypothetical protein
MAFLDMDAPVGLVELAAASNDFVSQICTLLHTHKIEPT